MVMDKELRAWQARLATHFAALRESRLKDGLERPIFGLEHGLDPSEVQTLENAVRADIAHTRLSRAHALVWIVYSSELGYRYSGDEYWQTFEQETPGWVQNGDRYRIRDFYRQFHRDLGGAVPSGVWAEHFSIICWPITHAILPKDLQLQLAHTLYELRHSFSRDTLESTESLGEQIAARSWNATSRFQNFVQEKQLVGQIATALLLQDQIGTSNLIHPETLKRIGADVDQERQAREWLRSARQSAGERVRVRGRGLLDREERPSSGSRLDEARSEVISLGMEPRLILRPTGSLGVSWDVSLEVPDLSHLPLRFPQTKEVLFGSRCTVAGSAGRPLARGRLLHGPQRIMLVRWPQSDEVLLQFEQKDSQLDFLLHTECLLRPGPKWLFRIASDGLAYGCRNLRVRPGERYILVSTTDQVGTNGNTSPIGLNCEGVYGALLDLPQALTLDWEESLRDLGLGQARTVDVWPAGLAPVRWDGDGYGEWLAPEVPCLGILTDHPLVSLSVSMGTSANSRFELTSVKPGEPVFVEFPQLSVGVHRLHFSAQNVAGGHPGELGDLDVVIRIREERPQSPMVSPPGPLSMQMDPASPTLEQLWGGRADLSLRGPTGREVECNVSFFERDGQPAIITQRLPPIALPINSNDWAAHFYEHFQKKKDAQDAYDRARVCTLEFTAHELGGFTIRFERAFTPLRWAVQRHRKGHLVRLFDDSGDSEQAVVSRWAFESPCVEETHPFDSDHQILESGGMFVARTERFIAAIIVPPPVLRRIGLADLRFVPNVERQERSIDSVLRLVEILGLWGQARLPGDFFSAIRQRSVLLSLLKELFRLLCGDNWAIIESQAAANDGPHVLIALSDAVSRRPEETGLGTSLFRNAETIAHGKCDERINQLASLVVEYRLGRPTLGRGRLRRTLLEEQDPDGIDNPEWLAEFSLRLASDPGNVAAWAGHHLHFGLDLLLKTPSLARAARFLVIATDRYLQPGPVAGELYPGWRWE